MDLFICFFVMDFVCKRCSYFIVDIAASAYGRDYLVTHKYSQQLIDTYLDILQQAPVKKSARLKK